MLAAPQPKLQGSRRSDHPASKSDARGPGTGHRTEITCASGEEENLEAGNSQRAPPKQQALPRWGEGSIPSRK